MKKLTLKPKSLQERIEEMQSDIAVRRADLDDYSSLLKEKATSPVALSSVAVGSALSVFLLLLARRKLKARRIAKHAELTYLELPPHPHRHASLFSMTTLMKLSSILSTALAVKRLFLSTGSNRKNIK
jgi:hypothetical protein